MIEGYSKKRTKMQYFLRRFRGPIRVPRISNRVPRIRENYHRVPKIRDIGSPQIQTRFLTFSLKKIQKNELTSLFSQLCNFR